MTAGALFLALALAAPVRAPAATAPPAGLVVWPARVGLAAGATTEVHVANGSRLTQVVAVRVAGFALDLRGTPRIVATSTGTRLLTLRPARLVIAPGAAASFAVRSAPGRGASPGDHPALVLLTARSTGGAGIGVRVRIGVSVEVRIPGQVRRRLELGALRVRAGRLFDLVVRNRGNVTERVTRGAIALRVWRRGRLLGVVRPRPRELLPGTRGLVEFAAPRRLRGRITVVVTAPRLAAPSRRFTLVA